MGRKLFLWYLESKTDDERKRMRVVIIRAPVSSVLPFLARKKLFPPLAPSRHPPPPDTLLFSIDGVSSPRDFPLSLSLSLSQSGKIFLRANLRSKAACRDSSSTSVSRGSREIDATGERRVEGEKPRWNVCTFPLGISLGQARPRCRAYNQFMKHPRRGDYYCSRVSRRYKTWREGIKRGREKTLE